MPDGRMGLFLARRFGKEGGSNTYGTLTSIDYANTRLRYEAKNYNYNAYDPELGRSDTSRHRKPKPPYGKQPFR